MKNAVILLVGAMLLGAAGLTSCGTDDKGNPPAVPTSLGVTDLTLTSASLVWTSDDADSWDVQLEDGAVVRVHTKRYPVSGLEPHVMYVWQVRAVNDDVASAWASSEFTTQEGQASPPENLKATNVTATSAQLSWSVIEANDSYEVKIGDANAVTTKATSYTATNLTPGTEYTWQVRAKKGEMFSDWVSDANAAFSTTAMMAPTNLSYQATSTFVIYYWDGEAPEWEVNYMGEDGTDIVFPRDGQSADVVYSGSLIPVSYSPGETFRWRVRGKSGNAYTEWVEYEDEVTIPEFQSTPTLTALGARMIVKNRDNDVSTWVSDLAGSQSTTVNGQPLLYNTMFERERGVPPYVSFATPGEEGFYDWQTMNENTNIPNAWLEYWETDVWVDGNGAERGDWRVNVGQVQIYSVSDTEVSGYLEMVISSAYEYFFLKEDQFVSKVITLEWKDIPVTPYESSKVKDGAGYIGYTKPTDRGAFGSSRIDDIRKIKAELGY